LLLVIIEPVRPIIAYIYNIVTLSILDSKDITLLLAANDKELIEENYYLKAIA
jgi:hypothetical protein